MTVGGRGVGQMCSILVRMMSCNFQKMAKGSQTRLKNKELSKRSSWYLHLSLVAMSSFCVQLRGGDRYRCSKVTSSTVHFRPLWKGGELGLKYTDFHFSKKKMDFLFPKTLHIFNLSIIRWLGMHTTICPFYNHILKSHTLVLKISLINSNFCKIGKLTHTLLLLDPILGSCGTPMGPTPNLTPQ